MKIDYNHILTITKKEWLNYFQSATGYILIVPFLLLTFFLFYRSAFISNQASLRPFFDMLPIILLLLAPAVAMRTFSQEQKNKTLELMFAHPITEIEIVMGKFLGSLGFYLTLLATTISLPITAFWFSNPDPGVIASQYLGAIFMGGAFLAIGIAAATVTNSQVASFLLGAFTSFIFILLGMDLVLLSMPSFLAQFVAELAILPHVNSISRGLLDFRDLLYFVTLIGLALMIAIIRLSQRKTVEDKVAAFRLNLALAFILGIGIILNILMNSFPVRLDLTTNRLFTLSKGTKQTLADLPDVVTVRLFTSQNLPGQVQVTTRNIKDTLKDYQRYSHGKVRIEEKFPDIRTEDQSLATELGIQQVQFNTLANNSFAVQAGFFGLSIHYGTENEVIPFIQSADDLEYQLTRRIRKLTIEDRPTIGIYTQLPPSMQQPGSIQLLTTALETQYDIQDVDLTQSQEALDMKTLIIYGIEEGLGATASAHIRQFVTEGGNAILLLNNHVVNAQAGTATPFKTGLEPWLEEYGLTFNQDIVFDTQLNETVSLQSGSVQYVLPYPFWVRSLPATKDFVALSGVNSVTLTWPNSMTLSPKEGVTQTPLLKTGPTGGRQAVQFSLTPGQMQPEDLMTAKEEILLGAALQKDETKLVVIGDSDFITDEFLKNSVDSFNFASALIDWVASDELISGIPRKSGDNPVFTFTSPTQAVTVQWINILLPPMIVIGFAVWYLNRRKYLSLRSYKMVRA